MWGRRLVCHSTSHGGRRDVYPTFNYCSLRFDDPDIAVANGITVVLEVNRAGLFAFTDGCGGGRMRKIDILMNHHAIVSDGHMAIRGFLPALIVSGGGVVHIVCLPH